MEILHQLVELLVEALPIVILVFLFYLFLRINFFGPLQRAMAERDKRIEGAKAEAAASDAAARTEMERYHEALKKARAEMYAEQESARQATLDDRAKLLRAIRTRSQESIQTAKVRIAAELATARAEVAAQTPALANEITRMILERTAPSSGGAR
ncbi:MAG: ATP synthase F0 subunit B [Candidatus Acidiferrales bacterium]